MSYCRQGDDSDVYVIATLGGGYECLGCSLRQSSLTQAFFSQHPAGMLAHLEEHRNYNHKVPQRAMDRLTTDILHEMKLQKEG